MNLFVFCVLLTMSINAEAYLDPGTGSMMLQVILGGIFDGGFGLAVGGPGKQAQAQFDP